MEGQNANALEQLLQLPPSAILQWMSEVNADALQGFNWRGLEEVAANAATSSSDREISFVWADVALAALALEKDEHFALLTTMMNLRAVLISQYGHVPGHRILDAQQLAQVLLDNIPWPYRKVFSKAKAWPKLDTAEIRLLSAYPNNPVARQVTKAQANCTIAK